MNTSPRVKKLRSIILEIVKKRHARAWKDDLKNRVKGNLTSEQIKETKDYFKKWTDINTDFCGFYTAATGNFYRNYIPDDIYYCKIDAYFNDWDMAEIIDNKCYYPRIFTNVKQPTCLLMRVNGFWYKDNSIITENKAIETLMQHEVFMKAAIDSEGGYGVEYLPIGTEKTKIQFLISKYKTDLVIQKALTQSKEMCKLCETSVNTIRVLSFLNKSGEVEVLSTIVRMGINGAKVDNASSGGITCGITNNGQLKDIAYSAKGQLYQSNPNNGRKFSEVIVPKYNEILKTAKSLHKDIPHFRLVSWDFALDENDEIILIEANMKYGELDFHQLNNGPVFGDATERIMDEVFGKA